MHVNLEKWGWDFVTSLIRHIGTAGMAVTAVAVVNGRIDWKAIGVGVLTGGVIPTVFTAFQSFPQAQDEPPK